MMNLSGDDWALSNTHVDTREILRPMQWKAVLMGKTWYGPTSRLSFYRGHLRARFTGPYIHDSSLQKSRLIEEDPPCSQ